MAKKKDELPRITKDWGWQRIKNWDADPELHPSQWAHISVYTYIALSTLSCSDHWSPMDLSLASKLLIKMGHPLPDEVCKGRLVPTNVDAVDRVRRWFLKVRKGNYVPSVINRNKRRLGARSEVTS